MKFSNKRLLILVFLSAFFIIALLGLLALSVEQRNIERSRLESRIYQLWEEQYEISRGLAKLNTIMGINDVSGSELINRIVERLGELEALQNELAELEQFSKEGQELRSMSEVTKAPSAATSLSQTPIQKRTTHGSDASSIKECPAENWCAYHRSVDKGWRHSPLGQITKDSVSRLRPAWMFMAPGGHGGMISTPLAVGGNIYLLTDATTMWRLNGATGERIWAYTAVLEKAILANFVGRKPHGALGLSIGDGRVYLGLPDGRVIAVDENSGEVVWESRLISSNGDKPGFSGPGTFVSSDLFVIGHNGGEYPVESRIFGLNPKTGDLVWSLEANSSGGRTTIANWDRDSLHYEEGGSWQPGIVDYANNQILIGMLNPQPNSAASHSGAYLNTYALSTIALDLGTGQPNWLFHGTPRILRAFNVTIGEYMLFGSRGRTLVLHPSENGFNYIHEADSGKPINVYADQDSQNWTSGFNLETGKFENVLRPEAGERTLVCPGVEGGHGWNAGTYSPETGLFYRVVNEWCMWLTVSPEGSTSGTLVTATVTRPGDQLFTAALWEGVNPPDDRAHGRITARDPVKGDIFWYKRYDDIPRSALMSTRGGLVFNATTDGFVEALDAKTGDTLWQFNDGAAHNGGIISYDVQGKQFVGVVAGHGSGRGQVAPSQQERADLFDNHQGTTLVVFALP